MVAAALPWGRRWVVGPAKVHAATFAPETPVVMNSFVEVLSQFPAYAVVVIAAPVGYPATEEPSYRTCDLEARRLLRWRATSIQRVPSRDALLSDPPRLEGLDVVSLARLQTYRQVGFEMSPYRQRTVYEGHPELSFFHLNGETPLRWSKHRDEGRVERRDLLVSRIAGIESMLDEESPIPLAHRLDVAAMMWTARRVQGRAAKRIPADAEWDGEGLRMEFVF